MKKLCEDCVHFRRLPGDTPWKRKTGCYHPQLLVTKQSDAFLKEQEEPGNHEKLNLRGDCAYWEARPRVGLVRRVVDLLRA
jgi:hypothetical protein